MEDRLSFYLQKSKILSQKGLLLEAKALSPQIGSFVYLEHLGIYAEVIGFQEDKVFLMPYGELDGLRSGETASFIGSLEPKIRRDMLGEVVNCLGQPIYKHDSSQKLDFKKFFSSKIQQQISSLDSEKLNIMDRALIREPLFLGVKAIDSFLTLGRGQRVGIFAGSGVGKSTLLGMIARQNLAEINVIALIGERSREVREFIDQELGQEGLRKSYVVVSTSDESPAQRIRAAIYAADTAKKLSLMGYHVLLMMDSLTRYCMALREVFLSMGEPPTSRGYTPSVLTRLPKLLEKAGNWSKNGSVTGIYTVLVDGDDLNDPIADHARATLDGHIVLSRKLAEMNQYPAIDVLQSISRCMSQVVNDRHRLIASGLRDLMAVYKQNEDLIQIGAYSKGSSKKVDDAIIAKGLLENYLKQKVDEKYSFQESQKAFEEIAQKCLKT